VLCLAAAVVAGGLAIYRLAGPQGIPLVLERHRQVDELRRQNAELKREIESRKARIQSLAENPADVELEIRRQLKLLKKEETIFLLPEPKK